MDPKQRGAIADALLGAGATVLLLFSTSNARGGVYALVTGIILVLGGIVLLWGTPRPKLLTRLLSSVAGLFLGFGAATIDVGLGGWISIGTGFLLLAGVWVMLSREDVPKG